MNPYYGREIPTYNELGLDPDRVYQVFRPPEELEAAAATFNNLPILAVHTHVTAENPKKEVIIGTTGSDSKFDGEYLSNSLAVWDAQYIDKIENDEQRQLSASYRYIPIIEKGAYNGTPYDIKMTRLEGNHVALVVEGRAGPDVLVADSKLHHPVKEKTVKLNPKQKAAIKARAAKLVAMDEASLESVEEALEEALEEVQAVADDPQTDPGAEDAEGGLLAKLKALLDEHAAGSAAASDEVAKKTEEAKKAEEAKNAAAMDAKIKAAADGARESIEGRFRAAEKVAPITGRIDAMAFDSAEKIYAHALTVGGMKPEDHKPEAYAGIVDVLISKQSAAPVHTASDSKTAEDLVKMFPGLAKINHA